MLKGYESASEEGEAYSECHTRSAKRVLKALLANGGMFLNGVVVLQDINALFQVSS